MIETRKNEAGAVAGERRQVAALPVRKIEARLEICLITTRTTGRWTIPKGWTMPSLPDHLAAAIEAEEEAGLIGTIKRKPIGQYDYWKRLEQEFALVRVVVYRLKVRTQTDSFPEAGQRRIRWFKAEDAMLLVDEPGLAALIGLVAAGSGHGPGADKPKNGHRRDGPAS